MLLHISLRVSHLVNEYKMIMMTMAKVKLKHKKVKQYMLQCNQLLIKSDENKFISANSKVDGKQSSPSSISESDDSSKSSEYSGFASASSLLSETHSQNEIICNLYYLYFVYFTAPNGNFPVINYRLDFPEESKL